MRKMRINNYSIFYFFIIFNFTVFYWNLFVVFIILLKLLISLINALFNLLTSIIFDFLFLSYPSGILYFFIISFTSRYWKFSFLDIFFDNPVFPVPTDPVTIIVFIYNSKIEHILKIVLFFYWLR